MTNIYNNFSYGVIGEDQHDPDISWQHHLDRGSEGGVDLAYPFGSVVVANADGVVHYDPRTNSAGWTCSLNLADGRVIQYMHLSEFSLASGTAVTAGQQIARSGASGFGNAHYYGAHLHVHMYIGSTRVNLFHYFTGTTPPPAGPTHYREDTEMEYHRFETTNPVAVLHDYIIGPGMRVRRVQDPAFVNNHNAYGGLVVHHPDPGYPLYNGGPNPITTVSYVMAGLTGIDEATLNTLTTRGDAEAIRQANGQWTVL